MDGPVAVAIPPIVDVPLGALGLDADRCKSLLLELRPRDTFLVTAEMLVTTDEIGALSEVIRTRYKLVPADD